MNNCKCERNLFHEIDKHYHDTLEIHANSRNLYDLDKTIIRQSIENSNLRERVDELESTVSALNGTESELKITIIDLCELLAPNCINFSKLNRLIESNSMNKQLKDILEYISCLELKKDE